MAAEALLPDYALLRTGHVPSLARGRRDGQSAQAASLRARQPAAERGR
jgi:hypothetical protein